MPATQWNDDEDDALQGLPFDAQLLYLRGLRRMMDFGTGEVGRSRRISWQTMREVLYVDKRQGCTDTGSPSRERLRRAAQHLERAGLVVMRSIQADKHLIFYLPLADRAKSAQKKPDRNPHTKPDRSKPAPDLDFDDIPDHRENKKPDQYPVSDNTFSTVDISEQSNVEKASAGGVEREYPSPQARLAVFLRSCGVEVLPMNPLLSEWIADLLVTDQECVQAVAVCRKYLGTDTPIPYKYFDKVLRGQRQSTPEKKQRSERRQEVYERLTGNAAATRTISGEFVPVEMG